MMKIIMAMNIDLETLNRKSTGISFRVLSDAEIGCLILEDWASMTCGKSPKASIGRWHLIGLKTKEFDNCVLVGFKDGYECRVTTTSFVMGVAPDKSALITENGSLYELHHQADGDPTPEQLTSLVVVLNGWLGRDFSQRLS